MTRYRPCIDFPGYRVGDDGSVWSCRIIGPGGVGKKWRRLSPIVNTLRKGYLFVAPRRDGKNHIRFVHRLILEAFVGKRPAGMQCRHLDGDVTNNRLVNLQWGTPQEDADDKKRHGTYLTGSQCHTAKITEADVRKIRRLHKMGRHSQQELARMFGLTQTPISLIIRRKTWKHVP
jgi:hypothetical protein